jgi:hypothetical protein
MKPIAGAGPDFCTHVGGWRLGYYAAFRVWAALRAAALRPVGPLVTTAFRAAACRAGRPRRRAACCAWRESARRVPARCGSRRSAAEMARERV